MSNMTEKQNLAARDTTPQDAIYAGDASGGKLVDENLSQNAAVNETPVEKDQGPPAWERLRQAREQRHMKPADIAAELRLDLQLVTDLEEGNFKKLPEMVYTAGYVRAYARLVELPPDEIVAKYTNPQSDQSNNMAVGREKIPARYSQVATALPKSFSVSVSRGDNKLIRLAIILVCLLAVLIIVWRAGSGPVNEGEINPTSIDINAGTGQAPIPLVTTQAAENATSSENNVVESEPAPTKLVKLAIPQPGGSSAKAGASSTGGALGNQTTLLGDPAQLDHIELHFSRDSWIDIRDATGKRLIRRMGLAGASKTVQGVAPFDVLIGYGPGVKMEYNGQPFDFSPYQGKRVARFTLSAKQDSAESAAANNEGNVDKKTDISDN